MSEINQNDPYETGVAHHEDGSESRLQVPGSGMPQIVDNTLRMEADPELGVTHFAFDVDRVLEPGDTMVLRFAISEIPE